MDTLGNVAALDNLFHTSVKEGEIPSMEATDKNHVALFKQYIERMVRNGVAIYSTISKDSTDQTYVSLFSDVTNNIATVEYRDIFGCLIHFHKCKDYGEIQKQANYCHEQTGAYYYQCIFTQELERNDLIASEFASSAILINCCTYDVNMKVSGK